jgi:hypothetical protein
VIAGEEGHVHPHLLLPHALHAATVHGALAEPEPDPDPELLIKRVWAMEVKVVARALAGARVLARGAACRGGRGSRAKVGHTLIRFLQLTQEIKLPYFCV